MPDTTQMEAILKGFLNVMEFYLFNSNSRNLDMIKDNFESFEDLASIDNT